MDIIRMRRLAEFLKTRKKFDYSDHEVYTPGLDIERQGFNVDPCELLEPPDEFCMAVFYGKKKDDTPVGCLASFSAHLQVLENAYVYKNDQLVPFDPNDPILNDINADAPSRGRTYLGLTHTEAVTLFSPWSYVDRWTPTTPGDGVRTILNAIQQYEEHGTFCSSIWDHVGSIKQ